MSTLELLETSHAYTQRIAESIVAAKVETVSKGRRSKPVWVRSRLSTVAQVLADACCPL